VEEVEDVEEANEQQTIEERNVKPDGGNVRDVGGHEEDEDIAILAVKDVATMSFD
jgi:hypothetical protein